MMSDAGGCRISRSRGLGLAEPDHHIDAGDFRTLYDMGLHPYLGGQLARLMYGNAAGPEATRAVNRLVASLTGEDRPDDRTTT